MRLKIIFKRNIGLSILFFIIVFCVILPLERVQAQGSGYAEPSEQFSQEELAQMLAPIALYPDALLTQVLMASTYPIEIIEADRWVRRNSELKGNDLDNALLEEDWDPSVKAICHFPSILGLMSERITETTSIGNAFLAQEADVMDMVQELRERAYEQNNLATNSNQKVIVEKETIIIQPANPTVIYVPYYDPFVVYGPWWYPAYPPYFWRPAGVGVVFGVSYWPAYHFSFAFGSWSYFDWHRHYIHIDSHRRPIYVRHDRWRENPGRWEHAPTHRRGVAYRDKSTASRYGQYPHSYRESPSKTRGYPENRNRDRNSDQTKVDRHQQGFDNTKIEHERQRVRTEPENKQSGRKPSDSGGLKKGPRKVEREQTAKEHQQTDGKKNQTVRETRPVEDKWSRMAREQQQAEKKRTQEVRETQQAERKRTQEVRETQQAEGKRSQVIREQQQAEGKRSPVMLEQQQRSRDNVFKGVEEPAGKERQASERGRVSRKRLGR